MPERSPFVGRETELGVLLERLAAARRGDGGIALVSGEPGIGKTRLLAEVAATARRDGWHVLVGQAYDTEGMPPYLPFVEALRPHVRAASPETLQAQLGRGAAEVALLAPELRDRLADLPASPPVSSEWERYRLFESVADLLLAMANPTGLLLVLDDLHWADRSTLRLLQHLARRVADAPVLVAGAYRATEVAPTHPLGDLLAELHREHRFEPLVLSSLAAGEVATLIASAISAPPAPQVTDAIHRETGGNPFFVEEVVRHLQRHGHDLRQAESAPTEQSVPEGVRYVIAQRLSRLSVDANRLLQAGAILGDGFSAEVVAATSGLAPAPLMDALDELLNAGLLREVGDGYHFTHALIRHTLDDSLNAARRQWLHLRAAVALEGGGGRAVETRLGEIAVHYRRAGPAADPDTVLRYAERAGEQAAAAFAWEEAAGHWRAALDLLDPADEAGRCERLLLLGEMQHRAGDIDAAVRSFRAAIELARRLRDPHRLARAVLGIEQWGPPRARADPAMITLLEEALDALEEDDTMLRALLLARLAVELRFEDAWDRRAALSRQAVAIARRVGDPTTLALTLYRVHTSLWTPDNVDERLAMATEIVHLGEATGDISLSVRGHHMRVWDLLQEDVAEASRDAEALARYAAALRQPDYLWIVAVLAAMRALLAGRLTEAEHLIHQALATGQRAQQPHSAGYFTLQLRDLRGHQGRLAEMEDMIIASAEGTGLPWRRAAVAELFADLGRTADARREFEQLARDRFAGMPHDYSWLAGMASLARTCAFLGNADHAAILYEMLLPHAARTVMVSASAACRGVVTRHLGLLAATMGRWEDATAHFEVARARHERMGARPLLAHTMREHAAMLLRRHGRGDLGRAGALLDQSLAIYCELGMEHYVANVEDLLSDRRLAVGKGNRAIADALVISPNTVERHINHLFAKTRAANRVELANYAHRRGFGPA